MARAALVTCAIAAAAAMPLSAARGAVGRPSPASTFVLRGVVVQYIPPSDSIVGSLSIRVLKVGARGHALLGELVTVPVAPASALKATQLLPQKSLCTVRLTARSPGSILKGASVVRTIVSSGPGPQAQTVTSAPAGQPANPGSTGTADSPTASTGGDTAGSGDQGAAQATDHGSGQGNGNGSGQGGDHGSGQENDADPGSHGRAGDGSSNGHK